MTNTPFCPRIILIYFFAYKFNASIGTRAFAVGAPSLWNMLPSSVKSIENIAKFRRHLKTYLYNVVYPH